MIDDEKFLQDLYEAQDYLISQYPEVTEEDNKLPLRFRWKMNKIIEKHDHRIIYYVKKVIAIALLFIGIFGGAVFAFDENARANVLDWFRERFSENVFHYHNHSDNKADIDLYSLMDYIPDGYRFVRKMKQEGKFTEIYSDDTGHFIAFSVISPEYDGEIYIYSDKNPIMDPVYVEQLCADLYLSETDQESNVITWKDGESIRFIIMGCLDSEQLIELAEKIN